VLVREQLQIGHLAQQAHARLPRADRLRVEVQCLRRLRNTICHDEVLGAPDVGTLIRLAP
jgi:hypothetical protein